MSNINKYEYTDAKINKDRPIRLDWQENTFFTVKEANKILSSLKGAIKQARKAKKIKKAKKSKKK